MTESNAAPGCQNRGIKVYADLRGYDPAHRYLLNDIVKALWNDRSPAEREQVYGKWVRLYEFTPDINAADAVLLTMKWQYYVNNSLIPQAMQAVHQAQAASKPVIVFSEGDSPANLPFEGVHLFETSGYRSRGGGAHGFPIFTGDNQDQYCPEGWQPRLWRERPLVGFCGLAGGGAARLLGRTALNRWRNLSYRLGWRRWEPSPFETARFRLRALDAFRRQPGIETNFILRERYRAGVTDTRDHQHPTRLEFIRNILDSDYTVCMRGGGNFSTRFYETLSLGRIPVFIDSDCLLPWHDQIDYRGLFPWVEARELHQAGEVVAGFHARLSPQDYTDLQQACRKLWYDEFTPTGFYNRFARQEFSPATRL